MHIIEQLIDNIPEGEYQLKDEAVIRIPEERYYAAVEEAARRVQGSSSSGSDKFPYRMKFRSTGLPLVVPGDHRPGTKIADDRHRRHAELRGSDIDR